MRARLLNLWTRLRGSYWFLPALLALAAFALSSGALWADDLLDLKQMAPPAWVFAGDAESARTILSIIASSTLNVTGVVFSITIVALTLASQQFGPRLLRNFMRDSGNQFVLGAFLAIYFYCLLILWVIDDTEGSRVYPISVTAALIFGAVGVALLIYFIHHAAESIQAHHVVAAVAHDLNLAIERLYSQDPDRSCPDAHAEWRRLSEAFEPGDRAVRAESGGYLQAVDFKSLAGLAKQLETTFRAEVRPGDFVAGADRLLTPAKSFGAGPAQLGKLRGCFLLGPQRTLEQDIRFGMNQLVEMAVRALSPGVNDPATAIACIDRLREALGRLVERREPRPERRDDTGQLRLILKPVSHKELLDEAFGELRHHARGNPQVTLRLLEALESVAQRPGAGRLRSALLEQGRLIREAALEALAEPADKQRVEEGWRRLGEAG